MVSATAPAPFDVLVIGAGPAGLAGAVRAAEAGARVALVDDNPALGGQIWRGAAPDAEPWIARLHAAGVEVLCQTRIVDQPAPGRLRADSPQGIRDLPYRRLLLATGARERFLPFPGWTLPHVLGAGGLQAMVKGGLPIAGKRVVVAGAGPLLLAVAAYLRHHGAVIAAVCDQAPWPALARFTAALPPSKLRQGLQLAHALRGTPILMSAWPVAARPGAAGILHRGRRREFACDYLACGFHLVPNTELAVLLGCATQNGFVVVNDRQETTIPGVYAAGELTGIGGLELSLAEGEIAGLAASGGHEEAASGSEEAATLAAQLEPHRQFARRLDALCALRSELRAIVQPDTLVCRCEDVTWERILPHPHWRAAKLHTRCGMGPCQGRVCGPALEFLLGWTPDPARPPIFPTSVAALSHPAAE